MGFVAPVAGFMAGIIANILIFSYCHQKGETDKGFRVGIPLASAGIFFLCYFFFGFGPGFIKYSILLELLLIVSGIDFKMGIIPNRFVLFIFLWGFLWQFLRPDLPMESALTGFLTGGVLFYVIALASKGGMGGGDIKLMAALGFITGWPYVLVLFMLSFILGALAGGFLLIIKKKTLKDSLPFAPFLSIGFLLVTFWGIKIWQWYAFFW